MARRVLGRRLNVRRPPAETAEQYLRYFPSNELFHNPQRFPRIDAPTLFGNAHPLHLEIGCGTGEYLCALAHAHPARNFVGVDLAIRPLWKAVASAAALALPNIIFIRADMRLVYPLLVPCSLHAVDLHFPDPNSRPRFRKRRLFSPRFLDTMSDALVPDGRISVMTDVLALLLDMLDVAERDPRFVKAHHDRYLVGFDAIARSRFQRIWEGHGYATVRFELRKQPAGVR